MSKRSHVLFVFFIFSLVVLAAVRISCVTPHNEIPNLKGVHIILPMNRPPAPPPPDTIIVRVMYNDTMRLYQSQVQWTEMSEDGSGDLAIKFIKQM